MGRTHTLAINKAMLPPRFTHVRQTYEIIKTFLQGDHANA
jgi:hypothetical protein